jgi:hypothetical protein
MRGVAARFCGVLPLVHYGASCVEAKCRLRLFGLLIRFIFLNRVFNGLRGFIWKLLEKEFGVTESDTVSSRSICLYYLIN